MSTEEIYSSIGENCLGQHILDRKKMRSSLNPFSWVRSNIDYINQIVDEDFEDFLNPQYVQYRERWGKNTPTNSKYTCATGVFEGTVSNEFEFTHHDVIGSEEHRNSYLRKTDRFRELVCSDNPIVFLYHHRIRSKANHPYIFEQLDKFIELIQSKRTAPAYCLCFTQVLVQDDSDRRVEFSRRGQTNFASLYTRNIWGGADADIFWGISDDDLLDEMFKIDRQTRESVLRS